MRLTPGNWTLFGSGDPKDDSSRIWRTVVFLLANVLPTCAVAFNILTLIVIKRHRPLQKSVSHLYIASLTVSDLLLGAFVMLFMNVYTIEFGGRWPFGQLLCDLWQLSDMILSTVSLYSVCAIGVDRWWNLENPLRVFKRRQRLARRIILAIWLVPTLVWTAAFVSLRPLNELPNECAFVWRPRWPVLVIAVCCLYAPVLTLAVLFLRIATLIRSHLRFMRKHARRTSSFVAKRGSYGNGIRQETRSEGPDRRHLLVDSLTPDSMRRLGRDRLSAPHNEYRRCSAENGSETIRRPSRSEAIPLIARQLAACDSVPLGRRPFADAAIEETTASDTAAVIIRRSFDAIGRRPSRTVAAIAVQRTASRCSSRLSVFALPGTISEMINNDGLSSQIKAAKAVAFIGIAFLVCWLPFLILWPLKVYCDECVSNSTYLLAIWANYLSCSINPVLYTLSSPRARLALRQYLTCKAPRKSSANNARSLTVM